MDDLPHQQMGFLLQKNVKGAILAIEKVPPNALFPPELGYILILLKFVKTARAQ